MGGVLIHIGYPKAGSSYLQAWFEKHPAMFYKFKAITGFYNIHDFSWYAESTAPIHECFVISSEHLSVWKSDSDMVGMRKGLKEYNIRAYQEKLRDTFYDIYPTARILIVTRGYTSLFQSFYSQYLAIGGTYDFENMLKSMSNSFSDLFDYTRVIGLYREKFGNDNVIVLPYELLRTDPHTFTAVIEKRMGIKNNYQFTYEKINASLDKKTLTAYRKVSNLLYQLLQPFPYSFQKVVYGYYNRSLNRNNPHPFMKFISRYVKDEIVFDGIDNVMRDLAGKAEILRNEELYQPYLKEYLL
jgi:hypothetical protein